MEKDLEQILQFQAEREWKQFHTPKNLAISLVLEAAESLELFQWSPDNNLPEDKISQFGQELADVYYYLLLLAHETGIDIKDEFKKKMKVNASKYPVDKSKGSSKKYDEL
ncbi:nucleotide pyrophosphohydrolase [Chloroflexota bacterium]